MIKNLFLFFAALSLFATLSRAQVSSVTGQYLQDNNILLNPGFESGIGKWVNSAGTFSIDYANFIQGKASGKIVLSSQALAFTQDSTSFVTALADGVQGLVSVYIKSEFPAKVCSRSAGSTVTTNCVDVVGNNRWSLYKVPSILGATSNGISVNTNGTSVTGTIYIDESFVGVTNLFADVDASTIAGESFFPSAASCAPTRTSTTIGAFNTDADCVAPTIVQQNLGQWQTTDSNGPIQIINNLPPGKYVAEFELGSVMSGAANTGFAINDGTTTCAATPGGSPTSIAPKTISCSFSYNNAGNRTFQIYGASSSGTLTISLDDLLRGNVRFKLYYFGSSSVYTSTNADTEWASCGLTGSAFTGFGSSVPTPSLQCKRQGSDLLIKGTFQAGTTPTAVEARMSLPTWNGVQLTSASSSVIPSVQLAGNATVNASSTTFFGNYTLIEPSVTYITFSRQDSTRNAYTKSLGTEISSSGSQFSINARAPINGWNNSNIIIGEFKEVVKVLGLDKQVICSADILNNGTASFSSQKGNCFSSVARSTLGRVAITIDSSKLSSAPICTLSVASGAGVNFCKLQGFPTSSIIDTTCYTTSANSDQPFSISCLGTTP
jgi:hypothetical protein